MLALTLLNQILETMEYDFKSEHLDLLLNTRVRKLIFHRLFSSSDECDVYRSLQLATVRCPVRKQLFKHVSSAHE